jgi:hypothetical protein
VKYWSSLSCSLWAMTGDCRWASAVNAGERTWGTQIWIGLSPCRRNRSRCALTFSREDLGRLASDMVRTS